MRSQVLWAGRLGGSAQSCLHEHSTVQVREFADATRKSQSEEHKRDYDVDYDDDDDNDDDDNDDDDVIHSKYKSLCSKQIYPYICIYITYFLFNTIIYIHIFM